jgi:hypothetical protein
VSSFGNEQVLVWYTSTGPHAVNAATTRADRVPDDVATVADVTSDALTRYLAMGYRPVISDQLAPNCGSNGGDGRLDVYLVAMNGGDGTTVPESGRCESASPQQCASYVFAKADYSSVYETSVLGIRTVLPHETFHAVQNAYDVDLARFWAEGTAQWATKILYPELTDLERNLPAFFKQTSHSLDAPANGVAAEVLYGSAIWPVFLSQRFGDDVVRQILEQEGTTGGASLVATDSVLQTLHSSLSREYPLFSAWNAATGIRAGVGGYPDAANYPLASVAELESTGAQAITSGLASFFFHANVEGTLRVSLATDAARNTGLLLPFEQGIARVDQVKPLPADLTGEGIVVVSGVTTNKKDAPFALTLGSPGGNTDGGGCAMSASCGRPSAGSLVFASCLLALVAHTSVRRPRRRRPRRAGR